MKTEQKTKVYILGAGCSARNGYPLAKTFLTELERFGSQLGEDAGRIRECVNTTVALMRQANVQTIDDLAVRIHAGHFDLDSSHGSVADTQKRDHRVKSAKIATAAMLLSKEKAAVQTGLQNYHELILELFPDGSTWEQKFLRNNSHVLTFNYDRLFELAILNRIEPSFSRRFATYGKGLLNSGFDAFFSQAVEFEDARFSYLKLHGSIGAQVKHEPTGIEYHAFDGQGFDVEKITDERFFPILNRSYNAIAPAPLLYFPFEKQHVRGGGQHMYYENYINAVWTRAEALIAAASEIHIIGYSFQALDRDAIIKLLSRARNCRVGIIQNLPGEAERICKMLEVKHSEIPFSWKPYSVEF